MVCRLITYVLLFILLIPSFPELKTKKKKRDIGKEDMPIVCLSLFISMYYNHSIK